MCTLAYSNPVYGQKIVLGVSGRIPYTYWRIAKIGVCPAGLQSQRSHDLRIKSHCERQASKRQRFPNCAKNCADAHRRWPTHLTQKPSNSNAGRRPPTPEIGSQSRCATELRHAPNSLFYNKINRLTKRRGVPRMDRVTAPEHLQSLMDLVSRERYVTISLTRSRPCRTRSITRG